jgi:hypothetical protein
MIYAAGIIGFIAGFFLGQMLLFFLLRHKTREELLNDPGLKWQFGTLNWLIALFTAYCAVSMVQFYFGA